MSYSDVRIPITVHPLHCKSISIGPSCGVYLLAKENITIGHNVGFNTRTSNNILIGVDMDGNGDEIRIGNVRQRKVQIGYYDLEQMSKRLELLERKLVN